MTAKIFLAALLVSLSSAAQPVVFEHVRLIDGTGRPPQEDSLLVIEGGRILAAGKAGKVKRPKDARVVDASGKTIIPGLIVSHGHVGVVMDGQNRPDAYTRENVQAGLLQYEQYGVTSVLTLGLNRDLVYDLREEQRQGKLSGASLFTAGRGIGAPGGAPPLPLAPDQVYRPKTADEAVAAVREMAGHHPDFLKIWVDDVFGKFPKMDPAVFAAVIDEAHRQKLKVASHVFYLDDAKALIGKGIDALGHSIRDRDVDPELIALMKERGTFYVATLNVDESSFAFLDDPTLFDNPWFRNALSPEALEQLRSPEYRNKVMSDPNLAKNRAALATGMRNLKALHAKGIRISFGTDSGGNPVRIPGWAEHRELELMVKAGLSPMDALVAATRGAAAMLAAANRGTLAKGQRADFVVLAANPLEDIRNTRQIVATWNGGREVQPRVALAAAH